MIGKAKVILDVEYKVYDDCPFEGVQFLDALASIVEHRANSHNHTIEDGVQIREVRWNEIKVID